MGPLLVVAVTLCELLSNPAAYDGKIVRVTGTHLTGYEASLFEDPKCPNRAWIEFDENAERETAPAVWKRWQNGYESSIEPCDPSTTYAYGHTVRMTVIARVDAAKGKRYGHLNAFDVQLTILKVESTGLVRGGHNPLAVVEEGKFTIPCSMVDRIPF